MSADLQLLLESTLTCPQCGVSNRERMPTDACLFFYECTGCSILLRPLPGHCCVFCSYGAIKCPPMQQQGECCGSECTTSAPTP